MAEMNKRDQGWMRMPPWLLGPLSSSRVQAWRCWWKIDTLNPKHKKPCMKMADIHLHTESLKVRLICYAHPDAQGKEDMKWWKTELPGGVRSVQRTKDMAEKHCWMGSNKTSKGPYAYKGFESFLRQNLISRGIVSKPQVRCHHVHVIAESNQRERKNFPDALTWIRNWSGLLFCVPLDWVCQRCHVWTQEVERGQEARASIAGHIVSFQPLQINRRHWYVPGHSGSLMPRHKWNKISKFLP